MLAMVALWKMNTRRPKMALKTESYTFLILQDGSEIDFESNICLAEKVTHEWKLILLKSFKEVKWINNLNLK